MPEKHTIALIALTAVILILTGAAVGTVPRTPVLGAIAPIIIPALLTWYLLMILAYGRRIIEMLAAFFLTRPKQEGRRTQSLLATILAWVIVLTLASIIIRPEVARYLANVLQQAAQAFSSTLNTLRQTTQSGVTSNPSASNVALIYYSLMIFGAIILVSFSLVFGALHKAYKEIRTIAADEQELRKEVLEVVQGTRTKLETNGRYHEAILQCYQRMCMILSGRGHKIQPSQTAREFAENVSGKLDLETDSVTPLTFLFEEARYSDHEIGDEKRGLALNYLSSLEHALASVGAKT
jgi:hypothetical protein